MTSPACLVADGAGSYVATPNGVDVADDAGTVHIKLADIGGVDVWSLSAVGSDDAVIVPALTIDYVAKTAMFTKPAGPWALIFQSKVNSGQDVDGQTDASLTTTFGVYVKTASKSLRLVASNERTEGSTSFGWVKPLNAAIVTADAGGGGGSVAWQDGTDTAYTITGTSGEQKVTIPSLTASRTWKFPASPTDGEIVTIADLLGHYVTADASDWAITVQGNAGTEHIFADGADQGTTYVLPVALLGNGSLSFTYRASNTSWNLA